MKRLLAALLALLMLLPALAMGENTHATLCFQCDEAQLNAWLQENGITEKWVASLVSLIAGLRVDSYAKEDEGALKLSLDGEDIVTVWHRRTADGSALALVDAAPNQDVLIPAPEEGVFDMLLSKTDMLSVLTMAIEIADEASAWMEALPVREEHGVFMGDAFGAGDTQYTYEVSSNDMTVLALQAIDKMDSLQPLDPEDAPDYQALKAQIQKAILQDARTSRQHWIARKVLRDEALIGISVTALNNNEQIMTISLGLENPEGPRIVAGIGLGGNVYFADLTLSIPDPVEDTVSLQYRADIWQDPHHDGFPSARIQRSNLLGHLEGSMSAAVKDGGISLSGEATLTRDGTSTLRESWGITVADDTGLIAAKDALYIGENETPAFEIVLESEQTDDYPETEWAVLGNPIRLDEESEALTEWLTQVATTIGYKLIFKVPTELLMMIMQ